MSTWNSGFITAWGSRNQHGLWWHHGPRWSFEEAQSERELFLISGSIVAQSGRSCCTSPCSTLLSNVSCCRPQPSLMPVTVNSSPFPPLHSTETAPVFSFPPLHRIFVHHSRPHLEAWLTSATYPRKPLLKAFSLRHRGKTLQVHMKKKTT